MSLFENDQYRWRETYFVLFHSSQRPSLADVAKQLQSLRAHFELTDPQADEAGRFESLTVRSAEDHAAVDVSYLSDEEVVEQGAKLAAEFKPGDAADRSKLARLERCNARFDVMHFEEVCDEPATSEEDLDEMLDPGGLLVVLEALIEMTDGVGIDPQSGTLL